MKSLCHIYVTDHLALTVNIKANGSLSGEENLQFSFLLSSQWESTLKKIASPLGANSSF